MKVEVVKVKISKLREVKHSLRTGVNLVKNLKSMLLTDDKSKKQERKKIICRALNSIFQDDKTDNTPVQRPNTPLSFSENISSEFPDELDELLQSLNEISQNDGSTVEEPVTGCSRLQEFNGTVGDAVTGSQDRTPGRSGTTSRTREENSNGIRAAVPPAENVYTYNQVDISDSDGNSDWKGNMIYNELEQGAMELENYYAPMNIMGFPGEEETQDSTMWDSLQNYEFLSSSNPIETEDIAFHQLLDTGHMEERGLNNLIFPLEIHSAGTSGMSSNETILLQTSPKNGENLVQSSFLIQYDAQKRTSIMDAAQLLYTKRTRTLLHWLDPNLPLSKIRNSIHESWEKLPMWQKNSYIAQVVGPMVDAAFPMLNPQLCPGNFETQPKLTEICLGNRGKLSSGRRKKRCQVKVSIVSRPAESESIAVHE